MGMTENDETMVEETKKSNINSSTNKSDLILDAKKRKIGGDEFVAGAVVVVIPFYSLVDGMMG